MPTAIETAGVPIIAIRPLEEADARELLERHGAHLRASVRERILRDAAGNPLALVELPAALEARAADAPETATDPLPVTARIERAMAGRLADLPEATTKLLRLAAIDDGGHVDEIVTAARAIGVPDASAGDLAPAVDGGLIALDDGSVRFRHPLIRSAIAQLASDADRRAAHLALAGAAGDPDRVAWHRSAAASRPDEATADLLEAAAERAERRGAMAAAVASLEQAARLTPDGEARAARLLRAADRAYEIGRYDIMARVLQDADGLAAPALEGRRQAWLLALKLTGPKTAREQQNIRLVVDAARSIAADDAELGMRLLEFAAARSWWMDVDPDVCSGVVEAAIDIAPDSDDPRLLFAKAAGAREYPEVVESLRRRLAGRRPARPGRRTPARDHGDVGRRPGRRDAVLRAVRAGFPPPGPTGLPGSGAGAGRVVRDPPRSTVRGGSGAGRRAPARGRDRPGELRRHRSHGPRRAPCAARRLRAGTAALAEAERHGRQAYADGLLANVHHARGLLELAMDATPMPSTRSGTSTSPATRAPTRSSARGRSPTWSMQRSRLGVPPTPLVTWTPSTSTPGSPRARGSGSAWPTPELCWRPIAVTTAAAEAAFNGALGRRPRAVAAAEGPPLLAYGSWLRRRRRVAESRDPLRSAREMFDAIGVPWMADRARRELGATGEVSSARSPKSVDDLTPQELQIARLAASGLSNRDIGERLYLSHRTVGFHLYHVYRSSGISGRAQLHAALGAA